MKMKKIFAIAAILSMLCSFTACGTSSKVVTRAERDEESSVSEVVSSEDETVSEDETSSEESKEESETESEEVSEVSESESDDESKAESDAESENEEVSETHTYEVEEGAFLYSNVSIVLPENFTVEESTSSLSVAYPDTYPEETDNINFTKTNESSAVYTEDNINKTMKTLFEGYQGCRDYKKYTIDGCEAVSYNHTITVSGIDVDQTQVVVFADDTVIITFTGISGKYNEAFQKAIDSIKVVD